MHCDDVALFVGNSAIMFHLEFRSVGALLADFVTMYAQNLMQLACHAGKHAVRLASCQATDDPIDPDAHQPAINQTVDIYTDDDAACNDAMRQACFWLYQCSCA